MSQPLGNAKDVFLDALEVEASERDAFLAEACGDDAELRARVDALLGAHGEADHLIADAPVVKALDAALTIDLEPGDRVGPFTLGERLGEGGFGVVFRAEQREPVKRQVALKVVKLGMDTKAVISRFEVERRALAMMEHPNIARVIDAGTTEAGRPFFAMELVDGEPITRYCQRLGLGTRARVELLRTVCLAVQHAHQKGIIHRDLKPSNVLVANVDGAAVPKVIDFGIAKATRGEASDVSQVSVAGQMIGTPAYMSPEQTSGAGDIDTRTDVYSLGALLYELLAGEPPFPITDSTQLPDLQRAILEDDPARPSVRRRELLGSGTQTGRSTSTATRERVAVPADLDWIVLQALEKSPARRYPTAYALALDLQRYLDHQAVDAAPPSTWYRATKLARRHRGAAFVTVALAIALLAGAIVANVGLVEAERERANVMRLSALQILRELKTEADELWPATVEREADFAAWLARAEALIAGLDGSGGTTRSHYAQLAVLEARGEHRFDSEDPGRRSVSFASEEDRWWHAQLSELVAGIESFADPETGLLDGVSAEHGWGVARRRDEARRVQEMTLSGDEAQWRWAEAIESIASEGDCPMYGGLVIEPQRGLLPIGRDPYSGLWEFAVPMTGEVPQRNERGELVVTEESSLVLVLIPGGGFLMGSQRDDTSGPNYDPWALATEGPVHVARLSPFFLSKYEMTQGQWLRFTGENPSGYDTHMDFLGKFIDLRHPVEQVTWNDCLEVLGRLELTLPTEAQWEYAARAGTETPWFTGPVRESLVGFVNLADRSAAMAAARFPAIADWPDLNDGYPAHAPVGTYQANGWGLHETAGNVWEWCYDGYWSDYLKVEDVLDPVLAPEESSTRVLRGASFTNPASSARVVTRDPIKPDTIASNRGLRPARPLVTSEAGQ